VIRLCRSEEVDQIFAIINDAARAYGGHIPDDCYNTPYMSGDYLRHEIDDHVVFWGFEKDRQLVGVMGIQDVRDVTLVRHAYVATANRGQGIGGKLLSHLHATATHPTLVGTWADATWAVRFYANRGFQLVTTSTKNRLLREYWTISDRQIETSVVLADARWLENHPEEASRIALAKR